jgi:NTE family protein
MAPHMHTDELNVDIDGQPRVLAGPHRLSMVYGGGGVFGIAYGAGVAAGLAATGIRVADAPSLGTSAGSWVASAMALGIGFEDLAKIGSPTVPSPRPGVLATKGRAIFGDATHPLVAVSAVCVRTRRRHILDGGRFPLADLVAASSAVPGVFAPHRVDGRLYVDGGMWSATSIDAAVTADHVIVIAPIAGGVLGPMGRTAGILLARELRGWRRRHPEKTITMIQPDREIARMAGRNPLGLFDAVRARPVYPLAYEQGLHWGERIQLAHAA